MKKGSLRLIFVIYLLGLILGGLYVGMVAPVRLVIQEAFGLGDATGIWMINIYTLFYAACIPVVGKLADIRGRKPVFLGCLITFAVGSLLCALSQMAVGFPLLLAGRLVHAVGACGIIPVANAEIGASFPLEKRGMALGIAAAAAGIANVAGAAVGSLIMGLVGNAHWPALFLFALPVCVALAALGAWGLPNTLVETKARLDLPGSVLMIAAVLLLLVALQGLDVVHLGAYLTAPAFLVPAAAFLATAVMFVLVERKAANPVFRLEYLKSRPIVITMVVSFFVGCIIISMTLIPELAEFVAQSPVGSGGLYVLPVGILSMFGPPLGGKLIDRFGPKPVMLGGLAVSMAGYLFLGLVSVPSNSVTLLLVGLCLMGLGMGFTMGAPVNYMILQNTSSQESGSAIATVTLVRQVGTTVAPAILLSFVQAAPGAAGFPGMMVCAAVFCLMAFGCMLLYRGR